MSPSCSPRRGIKRGRVHSWSQSDADCVHGRPGKVFRRANDDDDDETEDDNTQDYNHDEDHVHDKHEETNHDDAADDVDEAPDEPDELDEEPPDMHVNSNSETDSDKGDETNGDADDHDGNARGHDTVRIWDIVNVTDNMLDVLARRREGEAPAGDNGDNDALASCRRCGGGDGLLLASGRIANTCVYCHDMNLDIESSDEED